MKAISHIYKMVIDLKNVGKELGKSRNEQREKNEREAL